MIFDKDGNTTIITQEKASIIELVKKIDVLYERFKNNNIIVNITKLDVVTLQDIVEFLQLSNKHRKAKHSFVIVSNSANLDEMPDEIIVVPTTKEAFDIIEMEDMERDLGF
ncbi:ribonuclease Z [Psychroserpens algicola]|uniref:Ribonuclease Z n=1 Tax=Psychroserpens algicola TaxID=1719034 RepID=A0ABT0H7V5_9FLAO|nr:ribonuclease Z [Psychroserpens algicola]MCK8479932.1 ribonuclease Z [Psychroserpens algicola]